MTMLYFDMYRCEIDKATVPAVDKLLEDLAKNLRPFVKTTHQTQAELLQIDAQQLRESTARAPTTYNPRGIVRTGELFTDGVALIAISLRDQSRSTVYQRGSEQPKPFSVRIHTLAPIPDSSALKLALEAGERHLKASFKQYTYQNQRFEELKAEGRQSPEASTPAEVTACEVLTDKLARNLAISIKTSGGLLVRDLPKQLPADARDQAETLVELLQTRGLVYSEIVVVCSKTQSQVTRAPSREVLSELSAMGIKCACGRPLGQERIEEAITITDLGRNLLDKARWLTVLVMQELEQVGIKRDAILVEQNLGGDEIDCLANISGELALFELKDKEFSLGNAYSFGAKIGILKPKRSAIITTEHVGNDAKEHFVRASKSSRSSRYVAYDEDTADGIEISYIEGIQNIRAGIEQVASSIYLEDASKALDDVLRFTALSGSILVDQIKDRAATGKPALVNAAA